MADTMKSILSALKMAGVADALRRISRGKRSKGSPVEEPVAELPEEPGVQRKRGKK